MLKDDTPSLMDTFISLCAYNLYRFVTWILNIKIIDQWGRDINLCNDYSHMHIEF